MPGYFLYAAWSEAKGSDVLRNAAIAAIRTAAVFVLASVAPRVRGRGSVRRRASAST
jgi:hypothetical protein